ncbi:NAD(P)/FAD-dependent oxidoreductase [Sediminibacillus albus]|uniref:Ferredoxin--NADP reductase n=1 Tax=Sediminibacillus albus TaxID=407036 RepID=A0A1G9AJZ2_9BACI|nr:NAD(P)/FAD-dependent oxidoreductase [Sediminibacillus albus]SDK27686.1 thioredoxin reductase (NADPH) [Sediminibacillus albus]
MANENELYDVIIIGGGPTGLFAAFYSGMRDMKTKVIESNSRLGGKVAQFYPEKYLYDIGGIPKISGEELVGQMIKQASKHDPAIVYGQYVENIVKQEDGTFTLTTNTEEKHYAKTVIIATGFGIYEAERLSSANASIYEDSQINYTINNMEKFSGKTVMVVSPNRVGVDWALALESVAQRVIVVNGNGAFQHMGDGDEERLNESSVEVKMFSQVAELIGSGQQLEAAKIVDQSTGEEEVISVDQLLVYQGISFKPAPFQHWDLRTEKNKITVDAGMSANIEGIFAAGDAVHYSNKSMLIASGYTEASTAVNSAKSYINPKASAQVYSTVVYKNE